MKTYRALCPACNVLLTGVVGEDLVVICSHCRDDTVEMHRLYEEILRARPHLRTLPPADVFRRLWLSWQKDHPHV